MGPALRDPVVIAITISQLIISAGLYYIFPALVLLWQAEFGWSLTHIMGAFSVALIVQGLTAKSIGRLLDLGFGPWAMAGGGIVAAVMLVVTSTVDGLIWFYVCWAVLGFAMGLTLYDAVFALIIRARGPEAMAPIAIVTLLAGLASSAAFALAGTVGEALGWRAVLWIMAAAILVVHVPLVFLAMRRLENAPEVATRTKPTRERVSKREGFVALKIALSLSALGLGMVISHVMPLLTWTGVDAQLVLTAAAFIGLAQVAGRLVVILIGTKWNRSALASTCLVGLAVGLLMLLTASKVGALIFGFALFQGACYGISSALRPMLIRDVLGQARFGAAQGAVLAPAFIAFGLAPVFAAFVASMGGYSFLILTCIAVQLAAAALLGTMRRTSGTLAENSI